ncbi:DUF4912 domain-containing protein [Anabaena sp. 4-3]|uniref:DUF4912 domain-containing protein n=1 Tax=Anabaena sp. 4-3 TaxID=1811979 RepID=UPI00083135A6|nr:DUF4912 domain-containing protein [Anabaena sp. 4-3]
MWQKDKRDTGIVNLALWLAFATTPTVTTLLMSVPVSAQAETDTPTFLLPPTVQPGTTVRIDGVNGLAAFNQKLKQSFEQQFSGTQVEIATNGTEAALKAVQEGTIDIAAISRDLTPEEKAQGLVQVPLHREKIAIIVGSDNPFQGSLTDKQFAEIFRGNISNWSELGSADANIRVIDRPENSLTREALSSYPVFRSANFATGSNATQLTEDNTAEIVRQLGKDGISYAKFNQVANLPGVRALALYDTLPDDPKYPFSQPLVYVYKNNPNPAISAFLGFALAPQGQQAIETVRVAEAEAIAQAESQQFISANPTITLEPTPGMAASEEAETAGDSTGTNFSAPSAIATADNSNVLGRNLLWWLLLPIGAIAGSLLWFIRRPSAAKENPGLTESPTNDQDAQDKIPASEPAVATQPTENSMANSGLDHPAPQKTNNSPLPLPPELEQSPWDMEAPATIVNNTYPPIVDIPKTPTNGEAQTRELPDTAIVTSNNGYHRDITDDLKTEPLPDVTPAETTASISDKSQESEEIQETSILADLPDIPQNESSSVADVTAELPQSEAPSVQSLEEPEATTNLNAATESPSDESDPLTAAWDLDLSTLEEPPTEPPLIEISEEALNLVADAAEPPDNQILEEIETINVGNLADEAALAAAETGDWATNIDGILDNPAPETPEATEAINSPAEDLAPVKTISTDSEDDSEDGDEDSSVVLTPRNPEWAFVSWYLAHSDQQALENAGMTKLLLRLYDVSEVDLSYQQPHLVGQYECEPGITDCYVSIPASDRNYIIEIGYVASEQWVKIARSAIVRIFSPPYTEDILTDALTVDEDSQIFFTPRTTKWAYISWQISEQRQEILHNAGISQLTLRLYDVTYIDLSYQTPQLVQQYECEEIIQNRYVAIPQSDRDYMVEIGYLEGDRWITIASSSIVRVFSRPHGDFWFVTDAEVIIHGATDPGATVNIAGKPITLKSDGTFHLRIPFSEELIDYLITVSSENGEQITRVHQKFSQETVEA